MAYSLNIYVSTATQLDPARTKHINLAYNQSSFQL